MAIKRKRHSAETKRRVALEALKQQKTMNEITSEYGVHSSQISSWKKQALTAIEGMRPLHNLKYRKGLQTYSKHISNVDIILI